MVQPEFLASLRHRHRSELLLVFVQLEQQCPGWWLDLQQLSDQLGTDRSTLNRSMLKLDRLGLIRRFSISHSGGTYLWWVKRHEADLPSVECEPAWVLRDIRFRGRERITLGQRWAWAERHGIPRNTLRSFLAGGHHVLRQRWELVETPMDQMQQQEVAA